MHRLATSWLLIELIDVVCIEWLRRKHELRWEVEWERKRTRCHRSSAEMTSRKTRRPFPTRSIENIDPLVKLISNFPGSSRFRIVIFRIFQRSVVLLLIDLFCLLSCTCMSMSYKVIPSSSDEDESVSSCILLMLNSLTAWEDIFWISPRILNLSFPQGSSDQLALISTDEPLASYPATARCWSWINIRRALIRACVIEFILLSFCGIGVPGWSGLGD